MSCLAICVLLSFSISSVVVLSPLIIIFSKTKGAIPPTTHKEQQQQTVPMVIKMARVREKLRRTGEHILPGKTIVILEANIAMIIQNTILVNKQQQTAEHVRPMISQVVL